MNHNKIIIFGCGSYGNKAYKKLNHEVEIIGYSDNNATIWGRQKNGVEILSPDKIPSLLCETGSYVLIAVREYEDIITQLISNHVKRILVWKEGFIYKYENGLVPYSLYPMKPYQKSNKVSYSVLYLQTEACIRTLKIAKAMKKSGVNISLAFTGEPPFQENYCDIFDQLYPVSDLNEFITFLKKSEFDIVHSSNEPDYLSNIARISGIPVIHDCHDLTSNYKDIPIETLALEFGANKESAGVIYVSEALRSLACERFVLDKDRTFVLENYISEELAPQKYYEKLSAKDGKIHVVYEGGIVSNDPSLHYYLEDIFHVIASDDVQLHIYSQADAAYCKSLEMKNSNIHYEGNCPSAQLSSELTKYDVGICVHNVTEQNRNYLEGAKPNKIQEYINAGIPVAVGNVNSFIQFVESNNFGKYLDLKEDIAEQLNEIKKINIEKNILTKRKQTMESWMGELLGFYKRISESEE